MWRRATVTWALVAVNVLWFIFVEGHFGLTDQGALASGALDFPDVHAGQWYRLLSYMFVHFSETHLVMNMLSLALLYVVELWVGKSRYLITYILSGIMGGVCALGLQSHDVISGGASGAIFGIFGLALLDSFRGILSKGVRNQLVAILAVNVVYDLTNSNVSLIIHLGGLLTGMACGYLLKSRADKRYFLIATCLALLAVIALFMTLTSFNYGLPINE